MSAQPSRPFRKAPRGIQKISPQMQLVHDLLTKEGLSRKQVAAKLGITVGVVSRYKDLVEDSIFDERNRSKIGIAS